MKYKLKPNEVNITLLKNLNKALLNIIILLYRFLSIIFMDNL